MSDVLTFADEFFAAVSRSDIDAVGACYHDDVTIWHNYDNVDQTKAENLATLGGIPDRYDSFGYAEARTVEVEGRLIVRIEEYFDRGQLISALT